MVSHTRLKMTIEQAAALRVILKLEFVGKTGELIKKSGDKEYTTVLSYVVRNAEVWSRLDGAMAVPMLAEYRLHEAMLNLKSEIEVIIPHSMLETLQGILKSGEYLQTLSTSQSTKQNQLTIGSMPHLVIVERNLEALKRLLMITEKPELVFYPMKAPEGKPN